MKYAGIIKNDVAAAPGVCVSFFVQGCPLHCEGCHNPQTWDFNGGKEFTPDTLSEIYAALTANGVHRDFCVMGGEPFAQENQFLTYLVVNSVKQKFPNVKVWVWTGYKLEQLKSISVGPRIKDTLELCEGIVEGPFILAERDITLPMRGSRNQRILYTKDLDLDTFEIKENL